MEKGTKQKTTTTHVCPYTERRSKVELTGHVDWYRSESNPNDTNDDKNEDILYGGISSYENSQEDPSPDSHWRRDQSVSFL